MPISIEPEVLETEDDLFALLKELATVGWVGSVDWSANDERQIPQWDLDVMTFDPAQPSQARKMHATIGDVKIVVGNNITLMARADFEASYGPLETI